MLPTIKNNLKVLLQDRKKKSMVLLLPTFSNVGRRRHAEAGPLPTPATQLKPERAFRSQPGDCGPHGRPGAHWRRSPRPRPDPEPRGPRRRAETRSLTNFVTRAAWTPPAQSSLGSEHGLGGQLAPQPPLPAGRGGPRALFPERPRPAPAGAASPSRRRGLRPAGRPSRRPRAGAAGPRGAPAGGGRGAAAGGAGGAARSAASGLRHPAPRPRPRLESASRGLRPSREFFSLNG